jgi:nucleoside-diphosphate-sugar epimerase
MRALVTGGGGFVGSGLVRALREHGDEVVAFQRGAYPALEGLGAEVVRGDITSATELRAALEGVDVVFHVAAKVGGAGRPADFDAINVQGTRNVTEACVAAGVTRLVFCSSPSVVDEEGGFESLDESAPYGTRFLADYPRTKAAAERALLEADGTETKSGALRTCALRPHLVFGPGDTGSIPRVIQRAKKGRLRIIGDGKNRVDLTFIDNVVHAHLLAADALAKEPCLAGGKAYFITNDEPVVLWEWVNGLLENVGLPPVEKRVSLGLASTVGKTLDGAWSALRLRGEPPITQWAAKMMATSHTFRIDGAKRDLCYAPLVSMATGLERTLPWLKAELAAGRFG